MEVTLIKEHTHEGRKLWPGDTIDVSQARAEWLQERNVISEDSQIVRETEILNAARQAMAEGHLTEDGKPRVQAIEWILDKNISAEERDRAFETIKGEE